MNLAKRSKKLVLEGGEASWVDVVGPDCVGSKLTTCKNFWALVFL